MYRSNTYKVLRYSTSALIGFILWQLIHSGIDTHQTQNRYIVLLPGSIKPLPQPTWINQHIYTFNGITLW